MSDQQNTDFTVDIVSDVVCPWCIVGYKQLEQAMAQAGLVAAIRWHPFELNPHMSEEGENLREHLAAKYGTTPEQSVAARERLTALGASLGFAFDYGDDMRMANTFRAHQLLHWAAGQGRQHDLKMQLFSAFFTHRRDVNDPQVLAAEAAEIELDREEALAVLEDGRFADEVRADEQMWKSRGIQGVPAMIFNRRYLVTGAQGVDNYVAVMREVTQGHAA